MKNKNKFIGITFAMLVVFLLAGANASATVQYQTARPLTIEEAKAQIEAYINNPSYQKLKAQGVPYVESHYNETVKKHINDTVTAYLLEKVLPSGYEPLCPLLAEICYATICLMIALFGHGLLGAGMASIAFWTVNLCGSLVAGSWIGLFLLGDLLFIGGFLAELIYAIFGQGILYSYGLIGLFVILTVVLPVMILLAVLLVPIAYVMGVFLVMTDCFDYCMSQPVP